MVEMILIHMTMIRNQKSLLLRLGTTVAVCYSKLKIKTSKRV